MGFHRSESCEGNPERCGCLRQSPLSALEMPPSPSISRTTGENGEIVLTIDPNIEDFPSIGTLKSCADCPIRSVVPPSPLRSPLEKVVQAKLNGDGTPYSPTPKGGASTPVRLSPLHFPDMKADNAKPACDACPQCFDVCARGAECAECKEKMDRLGIADKPQLLQFKRVFTQCEVQRHTTSNSCWIMTNGNIYDVTDVIFRHPGGSRSILRKAGTDCTVDMGFHSSFAKKLWKERVVGRLTQCKEGCFDDHMKSAVRNIKRAEADLAAKGLNPDTATVLSLSSTTSMKDAVASLRNGANSESNCRIM